MESGVFKNKYLAALIIFVFSFLIYLPSLQNNYVWDDVIEIKKNYFKFERTSLVKSIFPKENSLRGYYRPVTYYTIGYDYKIWKDNPLGFHLTNIILNSISSILLFFLFLLILKRFEIEGGEIIAFFSSLLFIAHPMHVESVSWIAGRTDILCSLFFLAAFLCHIKSYEKIYFIIFTCLLFYISLLSKELAIAFPFTVLAYDLIADKKFKPGTLIRFGVYLLLLIFYFQIKAGGGAPVAPGLSSEVNAAGPGLAKYFLLIKTLFITYIFYFYKLITPFWFSSFITKLPQGIIYLVASILSFIILGYIFLYSYIKKSGFKSFCIFWLLIVLGPSAIIAITYLSSTPLAERYLYLPIAPFSLLIAFLLYKLFYIEKFRTVAIVLYCALFLGFSFFTVLRQAVWQDRITFWEDAARDTDSSIPLINYGMALIDAEKLDKGIEVMKKGLSADKKSSSLLRSAALNNLAIAYMKQGQLGKAEDALHQAIKVNKTFYKSYYHLGIINALLSRRQNSPERLEVAKDYYLKAISYKKNYARAYLAIARIYSFLGDTENAKKYARTALNYGLISPLDGQAMQILNQK